MLGNYLAWKKNFNFLEENVNFFFYRFIFCINIFYKFIDFFFNILILIDSLLKQDTQITVLVRQDGDSSTHSSGVNMIVGDATQEDDLQKAIDKPLKIREKINKAKRLKQAQLLAIKNGEVTPYIRSVFLEKIRQIRKEMDLKDS